MVIHRRLDMLPESFSFMMIGSLVGQSATGLQPPQRSADALAATHMPTVWALMGRVEILLKIQSSSLAVPWSHGNIYGTISCLKKCFVHDVASDSHAFHGPRRHRKMKNLISLDYSSDLRDDTNYVV